MKLSSFRPFSRAAARALSTTFFMSWGARNWPFLTFTGLPLCATARMKSVWRHRKAGVCSTSTTRATCSICDSSWMSVSTGTPSSRLTLARISRPLSMPGPRKVPPDERFALSKLLLKMTGMPSAELISFSWPATSICNCSDSITHGPAIRKNGRVMPTSKPQSFIGAPSARGSCRDLLDRLGLAARLMIQRRLDEAGEQRVAVPGRALELGVELHADEPWVLLFRQLDDLGQLLALRDRRDQQPGLLEALEVALVRLVAVAVALGHDLAVDLVCERAGRDIGALRTQAHRAAQVGVRVALLDRAVAVLPLVDQGDHRVLRVGLELGAVRAVQARQMARDLDRRDLHAQADAQVRDLVFARVLRGADFALDAALAEAAGHQDRVVL